MINNAAFQLTLQHFKDIGTNTRHFTFLANRPVSFLPGQFIILHWLCDAQRLHRNYSLANYGGYNEQDPFRLELAAAYVQNGFASEKLFAMQPGEQVEATGPFGRFVLHDEAVKRYLLIATGTGVTPYRTMLPSLSARMAVDPELDVVLLFGVRYAEDCLYRDELVSFAQKHPRFDFLVYYSRATNLQMPYEYSGYVTQAFSHILEIVPEHDIVYLCGHPNMVDDVFQILHKQGLPDNRIKREKYISPKVRRVTG
jgi:ferredoxin-NADP reductase